MIPHDYVFGDDGSLACTGGATVGIPLSVNPRGTIMKLRVVQLSGALEGFTYALYNTKAACDDAGAAAAGVHAVLYQVTPVLTVAGGAAAYASSEAYPEDGVSNLDMPYQVKDDNDGVALAAKASNIGRNLRLRIAAAGSGAKTFGVAMTVMDPMI